MDVEVIEIEDGDPTPEDPTLKNTNKTKNLEETAVSGGKSI